MDLLNKIDKARKEATTAEGKSSDAPQGEAVIGKADSTADNLKRGSNLLDYAGPGTSEGKTSEKVVTEPKESQQEQSATKQGVADPDSWTKDSALKEVSKLREENKVTRLKYQEQIDKIQQDTDSRIAKIEERYKDANEAKKKLEALEAEQADKKRDTTEKLAHREARIAELETVMKLQSEQLQKETETLKSKLSMYEAEREAQVAVYKDRVKEELGKIPEEYRDFADRMVKGFEDPREAWTALSEARVKGLFADKKVVVNHAVPGAADGARVNKAKLEQEEKERKGKMTSKDLIKSGLDKIKQGQSNSAFRNR